MEGKILKNLSVELKEDLDIVFEIDKLIAEAVEAKASDIHIEPQEDNIRIRYRVDGKLYTIDYYSLDYLSKIVTRIKIMANLDIAEKRKSQDGGFELSINSRKIDIRTSTILTIYGEKIVLRILEKDNEKIGLKYLGIGEEDICKIQELANIENGLIYLTGPTGCGKSTTLYSIIKELNREDINIITIEDPVEFKISGVNQIQVNEGAGINFSNTLRSILRQDPEIILVGETRDKETADISIRSSITGHKVFSTLHTNDSYSAIIRLLDMGIEDYLIRASVKGVISQRLVRTLCNNCKEKVAITHIQKDILKEIDENLEFEYIYIPVGCDKCREGFLGRKAITEILKIDFDFRNLIRKDLNLDDLRKLGKEKGIKNLLEKGVIDLYNGLITFEDLMNLSLNMEMNNGY